MSHSDAVFFIASDDGKVIDANTEHFNRPVEDDWNNIFGMQTERSSEGTFDFFVNRALDTDDISDDFVMACGIRYPGWRWVANSRTANHHTTPNHVGSFDFWIKPDCSTEVSQAKLLRVMAVTTALVFLTIS